MPFIETPADLAEWLADHFGRWSDSCPPSCQETHEAPTGHQDSCWCRICFVLHVTQRIREATHNEQRLDVVCSAMHTPPGGTGDAPLAPPRP